MIMSDNELREYYSQFRPGILEELEDFLQKRIVYLQKEDNTSSVIMKIAYDVIYTSTKHLWVSGQISEAQFWKLKEELSDIERAIE